MTTYSQAGDRYSQHFCLVWKCKGKQVPGAVVSPVLPLPGAAVRTTSMREVGVKPVLRLGGPGLGRTGRLCPSHALPKYPGGHSSVRSCSSGRGSR
jgi:hypothetical protein